MRFLRLIKYCCLLVVASFLVYMPTASLLGSLGVGVLGSLLEPWWRREQGPVVRRAKHWLVSGREETGRGSVAPMRLLTRCQDRD